MERIQRPKVFTFCYPLSSTWGTLALMTKLAPKSHRLLRTLNLNERDKNSVTEEEFSLQLFVFKGEKSFLSKWVHSFCHFQQYVFHKKTSWSLFTWYTVPWIRMFPGSNLELPIHQHRGEQKSPAWKVVWTMGYESKQKNKIEESGAVALW